MKLRKFLIVSAALVGIAGAAWAAEFGSLSTTDASNTARWSENQPLSSLNDGARALEGLLARWARDNGTDGCLTTSGTNTITVSPSQTLSAYYDGLRLCLKISAANTGAATLNADAVGAYKVVLPTNAQLTGGEFQIDTRAEVQWSEAASAWKLLANPATGFSDPLTTNGDLIIRSGGATTRLAAGASNTILQTSGSGGVWNTISNILDGVVSTTTGSMLARSSTGWVVVAAGTTGYRLTAQTSALPIWEPATAQPVFTTFNSGNLTWTNATYMEISHGLGVRPTISQFYLVNTVSDNGYSPGDELPLNPSVMEVSSTNRGLGIAITATGYLVKFGSDGTNSLEIVNKATGTLAVPLVTSWKFLIKAIK